MAFVSGAVLGFTYTAAHTQLLSEAVSHSHFTNEQVEAQKG